jgi:3-hydroxybutyrate dehydrogenase
VNNAGVSGFMGPVTGTPLEELTAVLRVNLEAPFQLAKLVLPEMTAKGYGRIVNISSVAARVNPPNSVTYNISKAGLNSLTASLSREVASRGVTVNALAPGLVLTDRIRNSRLPGLARETGKTPDELLAGMTAKTDTHRLTTEEELAQAVLFLCSPGAGNISGEIIEMSGGY